GCRVLPGPRDVSDRYLEGVPPIRQVSRSLGGLRLSPQRLSPDRPLRPARMPGASVGSSGQLLILTCPSTFPISPIRSHHCGVRGGIGSFRSALPLEMTNRERELGPTPS